MAKEESKELPRIQHKSDEDRKYRYNRNEVKITQRFETKNIIDLRKIDNLIICKEGENYDTPLYAVVDLSVPFILAEKPWAIQDMKNWL